MPEEEREASSQAIDKLRAAKAQLLIHSRLDSLIRNRMGNGWKVSLAFWSVLALLAGSILTSKVAIPIPSCTLFIAGVLLWVVALIHVGFIWIIGLDNSRDAECAGRRLLIAETLTNDACSRHCPPSEKTLLLDSPKCAKEGFTKWYSQVFQTSVTIGLCLVLTMTGFSLMKHPTKCDEIRKPAPGPRHVQIGPPRLRGLPEDRRRVLPPWGDGLPGSGHDSWDSPHVK